MAWLLVGAKPFPELEQSRTGLFGNKRQWNLKKKEAPIMPKATNGDYIFWHKYSSTNKWKGNRRLRTCQNLLICMWHWNFNHGQPVQFPTFGAFDCFSSANIDRAMAVQSFDFFWDLMTSSISQSIIVCKGVFTFPCYIYTLSLKMISLFVLQLSRKMCGFLSFIKEYRETYLRSLCDVIDNVITIKNIFSCIIWDDLSISVVNLKLCVIFWHFQNGRYFEVATKFFTRNDTGIWICYKNIHEHLWHFELLIDALAQILTEILHFKVLTYFRTLWRHQ